MWYYYPFKSLSRWLKIKIFRRIQDAENHGTRKSEEDNDFLLSLVSPESIDGFIENQAFLLSFDLAPPHPPPPSHQQVVSLYQSSCVSRVELSDGRGGGGGAKSYNCEEVWSSINYSILSGVGNTQPPTPPHRPHAERIQITDYK